MGKSILVTGGARSGKSALAERLTLEFGRPAVYVATSEPGDAEMRERIDRHRGRRGADWRTVEEPLDLAAALLLPDAGPRLVDCLTLWLSNLMHSGRDWRAETGDLVARLADLPQPVVFVTNEGGGGIVPENALARRFRDAAGEMNQTVANAVDEVWLSVAGCPLKLKAQ